MLKMPKVRRTHSLLCTFFPLATNTVDSQFLFFVFTHDIVLQCAHRICCLFSVVQGWGTTEFPVNTQSSVFFLLCASVFFFWLGQVLRRIYLYVSYTQLFQRKTHWLIFFGVIVIEIVFALRDIANVCISHVVKKDFYVVINKLYRKHYLYREINANERKNINWNINYICLFCSIVQKLTKTISYVKFTIQHEVWLIAQWQKNSNNDSCWATNIHFLPKSSFFFCLCDAIFFFSLRFFCWKIHYVNCNISRKNMRTNFKIINSWKNSSYWFFTVDFQRAIYNIWKMVGMKTKKKSVEIYRFFIM